MDSEMLHDDVRVFWSDPDESFIAVCPELGGLSAFGASEDEARRELAVAIALVVEVMIEDGLPAAGTGA